jgi:hypothetical protein
MKKLHELLLNKDFPTFIKNNDGKVFKIIGSDWSGFIAIPQDPPGKLTVLNYHSEGYELL